jgi:hypothetical protein
MREALGQPLQNISRELLNKVVSKEVARDLRKYKYNMAKTPSKENKRGLSAEKNATGGGVLSPSAQARRLNFGSPSAPADHNRSQGNSKSPHGNRRNQNAMQNTREVRDLLKEMDSGVHDKLAMLKMIAVKCGDADTNYKKIRQHLLKGEITAAEK